MSKQNHSALDRANLNNFTKDQLIDLVIKQHNEIQEHYIQTRVRDEINDILKESLDFYKKRDKDFEELKRLLIDALKNK